MKKYLVLFFLILPSWQLSAQSTATQALIDEYLQTLPDKAEIAIAWMVRDSQYHKGYRIGNGASTEVSNKHRLFEIGSISKTFTGALLIDQVKKGNVQLEDPISKYFPPSDKIHSEKVKQITLKHLVTHSSGLSTGPAKFLSPLTRAMLFAGDNPYKFVKWRHYRKYLRNKKIDAAPGSKWVYNNCGIALLGHILAERENSTWETMLQQNLLQPLGMNETYPTSKNMPSSLLVQGYDEKGKPAGLWDMDFINPAGSIKSCTVDMLKWLDAHLHAKPGSFFEEMNTQYPITTIKEGYVMGNAWIHNKTEGGDVAWHDGATGAYRAFCAFDVEHQTAIVILTNFSANHPQMKGPGGKSIIRDFAFRILASLDEN